MTCDGPSQLVSGVWRKHPVSIEREGARVEPELRGERALRALERVWRGVEERVTAGFIPELNPLSQAGALANTLLAVACVSGIVLLLWYETSVHHAYDSVLSISASRYGAGFVRSVHRYSSDGCMLMVLLHAGRLTVARRFVGARWLAWVTGLLAVGLLWFVGWLGYWLVWDERARQVALGTARVLDALPIFAEPISRSFLTDGGLSSLFFFVVIFLHMLVPLMMGVALWLHIARLSRPQFFTRRALTWWALGSLALISVFAPADVAGPARMASVPQHFDADAWFLLPMVLTDRLSGGALWAGVLALGALLFSLPWVLVSGRAAPAVVVEGRCTACARCVADCPYDAISMQPRTDGRAYAAVAVVDPSKCLGCGICAGSCDSAGIGLPWFDAIHQRRRLEQALDKATVAGQRPKLAFVCAEALPQPALAGHQQIEVPCAGWLHPLLAERALKRGASEVAVAACAPGSCRFREGERWTELRFSGQRQPHLRSGKLGSGRVVTSQRVSSRTRRAAVGVVVAVSLGGALLGLSRVGYRPPQRGGELVVSFKHAGAERKGCRELTVDEKQALSPHMRPRQICERGREGVRLRVSVDGAPLLARTYPASGWWADGQSIGIESWELPAGEHRVRVELGDGGSDGNYQYTAERTVNISANHRSVVAFDNAAFRWALAQQ